MLYFKNEDFELIAHDPTDELPAIITVSHCRYASGNEITIALEPGVLEATIAFDEWRDLFLENPPEVILDQVTETVVVRDTDLAEQLRLRHILHDQ